MFDITFCLLVVALVCSSAESYKTKNNLQKYNAEKITKKQGYTNDFGPEIHVSSDVIQFDRTASHAPHNSDNEEEILLKTIGLSDGYNVWLQSSEGKHGYHHDTAEGINGYGHDHSLQHTDNKLNRWKFLGDVGSVTGNIDFKNTDVINNNRKIIEAERVISW